MGACDEAWFAFRVDCLRFDSKEIRKKAEVFQLFLFFMKNLENKAYLTMLEISFFIFYVFLMRVPIGISNRHVHLSQADANTLFGSNYELTPMKELSQPGQYACVETLTIKGPK